MIALTQDFLAYGREKRADLVGIAPIARFDGVPAAHHPSSIFPEARSVVVVGKRIPRGTLRGIEEGSQFDLYAMYGQGWLRDRMLAMTTIALATWLEDHGWEAVPVQDLPPETPPSGVKVRPELPPPNVMIDVKQAAVRAGLGEIGYCGELLTPQFGPRQRCQVILTDAELEPSPMGETAVCDVCGECVTSCPLGALSKSADEVVTIAGKAMRVAAVDYSVCRSCRNGATPNPHHPAGQPDRLAAVCTRSCVDHLERAGRVENTFAAPFRQREAWQIDADGRTSLRLGS